MTMTLQRPTRPLSFSTPKKMTRKVMMMMMMKMTTIQHGNETSGVGGGSSDDGDGGSGDVGSGGGCGGDSVRIHLPFGSGGRKAAGHLLPCLLILLLSAGSSFATGTPTPSGLEETEESPLTVVTAVEDGQVLLPCEVAPPVSNDVTILVLFYHGATGTPIYSIDGRSGSIKHAQHWSDTSLESRAYFDMSSHPPGLVLRPVNASDHAEYRCRVDFRSSPTRNVRVQLDVIVPPKRIKILNEEGLEVSGVIGPYPVGASLSLECQVDSGRPRPAVSWFHEEKLLDDTVEVKHGDLTSNTLTLDSLTRQHLYQVLTCQASNSNLSIPATATVTLDMSFPPLEVKILGAMSSLSEGERYALVCESSGSRPTASMTWWKDGMMMTDTKSQIFNEGNVTRSTLYLTPTLADHNTYVACRAKNPMVPTAVLEDSRKLNVLYTPRLALAPGHNLDMEDIKEGDDVYFECGIQANPSVYKVQWFHNGEELNHNVSAGVIQSNQSLVLQKVVRGSSGQYTCSATNMHGIGNSNAVQLSVKFAPMCRPGQQVVYGGGRHEEINITCSVEAHPEPTSFRWAFNSSSEVVDIPSSRFWVVGNGKSQATYTPRTQLDYGTLLCWANNDVGRQRKPCIYHVIHASSPDPVNNCSVLNVSSTSAFVKCNAGWNGGLTQTFTLSVTSTHDLPSSTSTNAHHADKKKKKDASPLVLANTSTSPKPEFLLTGLEPGTKYVLTINGVNKKGESEPMRLAIFTLKDIAQKRTSPGVGVMALTPILGVLLGVVASLLLMVLVIVIVVKSRRPRSPKKQEVKMVYDKGAGGGASGGETGAGGDGSGSSSPVLGATGGGGVGGACGGIPSGDDQNPDIIPVNDDHQVKEQKEQQALYTGEITVTPLGTPPSSPPQQQQQQQQQGPSKDYLQGHDGTFYINPGNLLRQKGVLLPREGEGVLVGRPLAASTPAGARPPTQPTVYAHFVPENSSLIPKYPPDSTSLLPKYPQESSLLSKYPTDSSLLPKYPPDSSMPLKYPQDTSSLLQKFSADSSSPLLPKYPTDSASYKYPHDTSSLLPLSYPHEHSSLLPKYPTLEQTSLIHYPSTLAGTLPTSTLPKKMSSSFPIEHHHPLQQHHSPYPFYPSLTLGRTGSLSSSGRLTPSSTTSNTSNTSNTTNTTSNHNGSTSTVAFHPERPPTPPRDVAGSPSHRESSV